MTISQRILAGTACLYCEGPTQLVDSTMLYGKDYGGQYYRCEPCGAHVGCHPGTETALGTVANADLRKLRHAAHQMFDPLWKARIRRKCRKWKARAKGYAWLSSSLHIPAALTHIGMFDEATCEQVIALCHPYYLKLTTQSA